MLPFKDFGITLLDRPEDEAVSVASSSTVLIDSHRQGVEVNLIKYFLRSNLPFISSKGLSRTTINGRIEPALDVRDLGQGILIDDFTSFADSTERISAQTVLENNLIYQDSVDPYVNLSTNDGRISVLSDGGKLDLISRGEIISARGLRVKIEESLLGDSYKFEDSAAIIFHDGVGQDLTISSPGFVGTVSPISPYVEKTYETDLSVDVEYTYIGPDEKTFPRGFTYYGSKSGTDSVSFGGLLR